jgi:DNA modification methylase
VGIVLREQKQMNMTATITRSGTDAQLGAIDARIYINQEYLGTVALAQDLDLSNGWIDDAVLAALSQSENRDTLTIEIIDAIRRAMRSVAEIHRGTKDSIILVGDVRDRLRELESESVQCVVTSPPYWGLRDYDVAGQIGLEATPDDYVNTIVAVFREVRRVLREDGTVWLNIGDSYFGGGYANHRVNGSEWLSAHGGDRRQSRQQDRINANPSMKPKDLCLIPFRLALALQSDGWYVRSDIIWAKGYSFHPTTAGSIMPESARDRPSTSHEHVFLLTKSSSYFYDGDAVREQGIFPAGTRAAKGSGTREGNRRSAEYATYSGTRNLRSVWLINPKPFKQAHFATFPPALVEPCIKAGSGVAQAVLDPFCGSGTVGVVAKLLRRRFIGIELSPTYAAMSRARIDQTETPHEEQQDQQDHDEVEVQL